MKKSELIKQIRSIIKKQKVLIERKKGKKKTYTAKQWQSKFKDGMLKWYQKGDMKKARFHYNDMKNMIMNVSPQETDKINKQLYKKYQKIRHELKGVSQSLNQKKIPKKGTPEWYEYKIAVDTIKNPLKGKFMSGPSQQQAIKTLKNNFGFTDKQINRLK